MTPRVVILICAAAATPAALDAQQQPPPTCAAAEYRQFDFWIGTWDVFNPQGQMIGMNTIVRDLNGCVLHERWQSLGSAHRGNSYNIYDRATATWHQSWVDNSGLLLLIDGQLTGRSMILSGTTRNAQGQETINRITWTPVTADSVQQLWETSTDGGSTWSTAFDGRYVRRR